MGPADSSDLFHAECRLWNDILEKFASEIGGSTASMKPTSPGYCLAIFNDEAPEGKAGITQIALSEDGGEFHSSAQCRNGQFYVRYQLEEDDEYFGARVLMLDP